MVIGIPVRDLNVSSNNRNLLTSFPTIQFRRIWRVDVQEGNVHRQDDHSTEALQFLLQQKNIY